MRRDRTGEPVDDPDEPSTATDDEPPPMTSDEARAHIRRLLNTDQRGGAT